MIDKQPLILYTEYGDGHLLYEAGVSDLMKGESESR